MCLANELVERGIYDEESVDTSGGIDMNTFTKTRAWRAGALVGHLLIWSVA